MNKHKFLSSLRIEGVAIRSKAILISLFLFCGLALAATDSAVVADSIIEKIKSHKGIEIGGTVRSSSFNSTIESPQEQPATSDGRFKDQMPDHEIAEFVQVDLDFKFRPFDNISANLKLRLGAGMQEFFAAAATTVNSPWMNIEGQHGNWFYWVVGDFRQSWSPLTLYSPSIDIMYEPTVFARNREMAQKDALLEGNKKNLQGFNLQFRPNLGGSLGELRIELLGARLRRAGYLDASGVMGNLLPNEGVAGATQAGRFDKFLGAGNLEWLPLNKNILLGGTYLAIIDDKSSKYPLYSCPSCSEGVQSELNTPDSLPQKTFIFAGRAGADIAKIIKQDKLIVNFVGEFANSNDKVYDVFNVTDENDDVIGTDYTSKQIKGNAFLGQLDLGYKWIFDAVLSSSFVRNDSGWFNNVAQTPSFFARRNLNSDKDLGCNNGNCENPALNLSKYGVYSPLYSTFDALYFFTPKHSPISTTLSNQAPQGQTISYNTSPYARTSYNANTLTRAELALLEELYDANLQLSLPNGYATANRMGFEEKLTLSWKGLVEAKGLFSNFEQISALAGSKKAKFTEFGGGAKVNVLGLAGFAENPLELSGSYKHSAKEQNWESLGNAEFNSDFINGGVYYRFYKRFGVTFGYQRIDSDLNLAGADALKNQTANFSAAVVPVIKSSQNQWMAGIDYTVAPHAWLAINYGIMTVENTYDIRGFETDGSLQRDPITTLPNYLVANGADSEQTKLKHKFSRNIIEATINVEF